MKIEGRLQALESRADALVTREVHWVIQCAPQTRDDALDVYGRDKIVSDDEVVFFRVGFGPRALKEKAGQMNDRPPRVAEGD